MKLTTLKTFKEHLVFWVLYGLYFYALNVLGNDDMTMWTALLSLPYFALVFYVVYFIIRRFVARRNYLKGIALLLCFYLVSSLLVYILSYGWQSSLIYGKYVIADYDFSWREFLQTLLVLHGHFSLLAMLYFHYREKLRATQSKLEETERRLEAERVKKRFEYATLSAQVCPHLMANIFQALEQQLNNTVPLLAQQVNRLYHLMRFYMDADRPDLLHVILLEDEVDAVQNYLYIQQHIIGRNFAVDFSLRGNPKAFSMPPTTLLTLVENAFKHGLSNDPEKPIRIQVHIDQDGYSIVVENHKSAVSSALNSHAHGLINLRRRLEIRYGPDASVTIKDTVETYHISIVIKFKHLKNLSL